MQSPHPWGRGLKVVIFGECSKLSLDFVYESLLGGYAYLTVYYFAIFENQNRRDVADAVLHRNFGVGIDVNLAYYYFALIFFVQLLDDGRNHVARAAPFCPKVNNGYAINVQCRFFEVTIR